MLSRSAVANKQNSNEDQLDRVVETPKKKTLASVRDEQSKGSCSRYDIQ